MGLSFLSFMVLLLSSGADMPFCGLVSQSEIGRGFRDYRCVAFIHLFDSFIIDIWFVQRNQGIGGLVGKSTSRHLCCEKNEHVFTSLLQVPRSVVPS